MTVPTEPDLTVVRDPGAEHRLPAHVSPSRYDLVISPDLAEAVFTGTVAIELTVHERTDRIVCNAVELEVLDARVARGWTSQGDAPGEATACLVELDARREQVIFHADTPLVPGRYRLTCTFSGVLNDKLDGFYRSTFDDDDGTTHVIATTQFAETSARRAFPCFDEPAAKAVFAVTLDAPPGCVALSNGPEIDREELSGGATRHRFGPTIPMSTYLVAFVVGPIELTAPRDVGGVAVRVAYVPGRAPLAGAALDAAEHALAFFASYFAIPYPGDKLDLVALPDFAAGAMENLGCVTFREAILLSDPDDTTHLEHERLIEVVDHELAHMWFGDLVTMRWWNGIWLNEAFATFMALLCQNDYKPAWDVFTSFALSRAAAFATDSLHSTRAVEYPVHAPEDAAAMFDILTYEKGAGVLWMFERFLGPERFRAGVRDYLERHRFGNTETGDFFDALGAQAPDVQVREALESFIFQGGYPLVRATSVEGDSGRAITITQEPFSYLSEEEAGELGTLPEGGSAIGQSWLVPMLTAPVGAGHDEVHRVLLAKEPEQIARGDVPVVLNAGGTGFYRLSYDAVLLDELLPHFYALSPLERFNLLGDTWATVLAGRAPLGDALTILDHLRPETDPHVWSLAASVLSLLDLVAPDKECAELHRHGRAIASQAFARVGFEPRVGETRQDAMLRSTLITLLGRTLRDPAVIARAHALFAQDHDGGPHLDPNVASAVLGVVMSDARREELDAVLARVRRPRDPMDQVRRIYSLASLRDPASVAEVLELCLSSFRSQNAPQLVGAMLAQRASGPLAFSFVREHFAEMSARFPDNLVHRMLAGVSGLAQLDDAGEPIYLAEVLAFARDAVSGAKRRHIDQALERLAVNLRLARAARDGALATLSG